MFPKEDIEKLEREAAKRGYDLSRLFQLSNALKHMVVKYKHGKEGNRWTTITCFKTKKVHHYNKHRHRDNF